MKNYFHSAVFFLAIAVLSASSLFALDGVADSPRDICPLKIGDAVPELTLETETGVSFDLNDAFREKPTILIFFRGSWCPYCNVHLEKISRIEDDLVRLGYQIFAISLDKPEHLRDSDQTDALNYTLLSDADARATIAFGLAFRTPDDYYKKLLTNNVNLEERSGNNRHILPVPAAFVIDTYGIIQFEYLAPDYTIRIDPDLLLKAAEVALRKDKPAGEK